MTALGLLLNLALLATTSTASGPASSAPPFGAAPLAGGGWTSLSQFTGPSAQTKRPVLLSFWSTSCVVCKQELPRVERWAKSHPEIAFLPVLSQQVPRDSALGWLKRAGVFSTGLHDPSAVVAKSYGVCTEADKCTMPSLFLIAPDRTVLLARQGYSPTEPLEARLDSALRR